MKDNAIILDLENQKEGSYMKILIRKRRLLAFVCAMTLALGVSFTVHAAVSGQQYYWAQGTTPSVEFDAGTLYPTSQVFFDGIATSPNSGSFQVQLYKKVGWWWTEVGSARTVYQNSNTTYSLRSESMVQGQFFRVGWVISDNAQYKIRLSGATVPQNTVIREMYIFGN